MRTGREDSLEFTAEFKRHAYPIVESVKGGLNKKEVRSIDNIQTEMKQVLKRLYA